jgi:hypothetical protein
MTYVKYKQGFKICYNFAGNHAEIYESGDMTMTEERNRSEAESLEELLISSLLEQEALINVLLKKGIITPSELMEEIKKLQREQ